MHVLGSIVCPHQDGDFVISVLDLKNWSTGSCMVRQVGQCQTHDILVTKAEAKQLADILNAFAAS